MEILIITILSACIFAYTLIKWSMTPDKKPKGYKEEGTLEIVSNPIEEKSPEDYKKSRSHPICKDCACYLWAFDECGYDKPTSVIGIKECLYPCDWQKK